MRLFFLFAIFLAALPAQVSLRALSNQFQSLAASTDHAVVQIITRSFAAEESGENPSPIVRSARGAGSGVLITADGHIVTNAHVVNAARRIQVLVPQRREDRRAASILKNSGTLYNATIVGIDRETDIAVLKIDGKNLPFLQFGDSDLLRPGQLVLAFGSPLGLQNSVTMGIVSSTARQVRPEDPMIYIQTDAAINPGNSGGPLIDADGNLVGINTFILTQSGGSEGIGFAAPSNIVKSAADQIRQFGVVRRGQIGLTAQTITPMLAQALGLTKISGVLVEDVAPQSSASAAGLQIRDIVLSVNGKPLENGRQLGVNVYQNAGKSIELEVLRGTQQMKIVVAVLERPKDFDRIIGLVSGDANRFRKLGILAVSLDEKVTPMLPELRKSTGVVVAGITADLSIDNGRLQPGDIIHEVGANDVHDTATLVKALDDLQHGAVVAVQIERQGQFQFILVEID